MEEQNVAIVTGGTRGIGAAISQALIAGGYQVAALYCGNDEAARAFEAGMGEKARAFKADVADFSSCEKAVVKICDEMGVIDVLVNNAGITRDSVLHKMSAEHWDDVLRTNLYSCFNMCHAVMPEMRARGKGRVINISSINGQKGQFGQTNYAAAKAGMIGFTKSLALESAAKGITVNAVCPGYIETDMTASMNPDVLGAIIKQIPAARMGKVEEIAEIVAFLASDKAAFINGATISANGAQYMA